MAAILQSKLETTGGVAIISPTLRGEYGRGEMTIISYEWITNPS